MRKLSNGKVVRSEAEWQRIFESHRSSGLSRAAFCRREKIALGSFSNWEKRLRDESAGSDAFIEWSAPEVITRSAAELELSLPGGVTLRWKL